MIREFRCAAGHLTERILTREQDEQLQSVSCSCGLPAARLEFSTCGFILKDGGAGGFYRPHSRAMDRPVTTGGGKNVPDIPGVTRPAKGNEPSPDF